MTRLILHVRVKFRAFGITFGRFERVIERTLPVLVPGVAPILARIDERGVYVLLTHEPAPSEPTE